MKTFHEIFKYFSRDRFSGIGVLENNVEVVGQRFSTKVIGEKRESTRVEISVPVWYRVKNRWSKWLLGKSVDYSTTGIRLSLPSGVAPGTEISLRMKLPDSATPIDLKGFVVWVEPISTDMNASGMVECGVAFKMTRDVAHKEQLVYLIANKLCKIGLELSKKHIVRPVESVDDLKKCYRIVYDGYVARKYCFPNEKSMHYHYFSFLPESRTFALKEKNNLVATVSLVVDSPCGLPMDRLFSRELDHLRGSGRKLAEVTLLAVATNDKKRQWFSLTNLDKQVRLFCLFKILYEYARNVAGVTDLIIGVHPKHEILYKYLMFKSMGSAKSYPGACGNLALPLHMNLASAEENCSNYLRMFFLSEPTPLEIINSGLVMNADVVNQFLCADPQMWSNIPEVGQRYLKKCYPAINLSFRNPIFNFFSK